MKSNDSVKQELLMALERITSRKTIYLQKGAKLSQANVIRETGRDVDDLKLSRFPSIANHIKSEVDRIRLAREKGERKSSRKRRSISQQLYDAKLQRNQMSSIISAQNDYILQLQDEIQKLLSGVIGIDTKKS